MNINLKTPGLNNPETHVLTHNRFNTYVVLTFTDLKKAQIYKMPYRDSPHHEIEMVIKFDYQHLYKPFDLDKKTHARIVTNENFLFKIEDKKHIFVFAGEKVYNFETIDDIDETFSKTGNNDIKYPLLSVKKKYITWHFRNILLLKNLKIRKCLTNINICIKKTLT